MLAGFAVLGVISRKSPYQLRQWIGGTRLINCLISIEGFHRQFYVKVALDDAGADLASRRIQQLHSAGFQHETWVDRDQLLCRIPHLTKSVLGGVLVEGDGWALPWKITRAFHDKAAALGAEFRTPSDCYINR